MNVDSAERNILSLCTGYGGLDQAVEMVFPPSRVVAHVEIEAWAVENLASKMDARLVVSAPVWTNLKTFDARPFRGMVDIITAGYPCQPFSVAGKRKGTNDPRHLWPYIRDIVNVVRPGLCVFENVRGHVRLGLSKVLGELRELGYRVRAGIFSAAEVGAPHRRERIFIVACRDGAESGGLRSREKEEESFTRNSGNLADAERRGRKASALPVEDAERIGRSRGRNGHGTCETGGLRPETETAGPGAGPESDVADANSPIIGQRKEAEPDAESFRSSRWPAGPGQRQHEWEAPRTVNGKLNADWVESLMDIPKGWTRIEGEPDNAWREDRLRLCGNGVIPAQAEFAVRTLVEDLTL